MTSVEAAHRNKLWLYGILTLVLAACMWAGWRDFNPQIPQDEVRENIRSTIRRVIQVLVQYVIPGAIVLFFTSEALAKFRGEDRSEH